jgi:hypothetical protein
MSFQPRVFPKLVGPTAQAIRAHFDAAVVRMDTNWSTAHDEGVRDALGWVLGAYAAEPLEEVEEDTP